jgi:hypothetical protein
VSALAAVLITLSVAGTAFAAPAASQTMHFSTLQQWGTPLGPTTSPSSCPADVLNDYVWIDASGNGVSHQILNGAGDFWATTTFTGEATLTMYPTSSLSGIGTDAQGNTTATVTGPSDGTVTGHFTEWFGISANAQNGVIHGTIHFQGTDSSGAHVFVSAVFHAAWLPGADPNGPPSFYFDRATC